MQQLNVLPINVSKTVETKDESIASASSSSKSEFSQHIDLHLSKNKDSGQYDKKAVADNVGNKSMVSSPDKSSPNTDKTPQQMSDQDNVLTDNSDTANIEQEVAATGKNAENEVSKEQSNENVDESDLLMSFLIKADKALLTESLAENTTHGDLSAEQKAKYEAQLLMKSSGLVADLSTITKALNSETSTGVNEVDDPEGISKELLLAARKAQTNSTGKQISGDQSAKVNESQVAVVGNKTIDTDTMIAETTTEISPVSDEEQKNSRNLINDKSILEQQINAVKSAQESKLDTASVSKDNINTSAPLANNSMALGTSSNDNTTSEELAFTALGKQKLSSEGKDVALTDNKIATKPSATTSANNLMMSSDDTALESEAKLNEKLAQLSQKQTNSAKADNSTAANFQNQGNNKSTASPSVAQASTIKNDVVNSEAQLSAKSVEHLIEQSKDLNSSEHKEVSNKTLLKTSGDFTINNNFIEGTGRATQAAQDMMEQQVAEVFNPMGSSEVSQSQKTNTQLHHETIAIFRRDFADAVKDKVMLMISQKLQQFDITLDPPELGNMQVRVNLQGEQATVNFVVQNQQAKEAFEQNMHKLRDLLAEQGVDVGEANVEQQSENEANNQGNDADNQHNSMANTADASDVIEHNLSARMINSSATAIDYYA